MWGNKYCPFICIAVNETISYGGINPNEWKCENGCDEEYMRNKGCRKNNPQATSRVSFSFLDGKCIIDHCPGIYRNSLYYQSLNNFHSALQVGFSNPDLMEMPHHLVDALSYLKWCRDYIAYCKETEELKKVQNGNKHKFKT